MCARLLYKTSSTPFARSHGPVSSLVSFAAAELCRNVQVRASVSGKEINGYLEWNRSFGSFPAEEEGAEDEMLG